MATADFRELEKKLEELNRTVENIGNQLANISRVLVGISQVQGTMAGDTKEMRDHLEVVKGIQEYSMTMGRP